MTERGRDRDREKSDRERQVERETSAHPLIVRPSVTDRNNRQETDRDIPI